MIPIIVNLLCGGGVTQRRHDHVVFEQACGGREFALFLTGDLALGLVLVGAVAHVGGLAQGESGGMCAVI